MFLFVDHKFPPLPRGDSRVCIVKQNPLLKTYKNKVKILWLILELILGKLNRALNNPALCSTQEGRELQYYNKLI